MSLADLSLLHVEEAIDAMFLARDADDYLAALIAMEGGDRTALDAHNEAMEDEIESLRFSVWHLSHPASTVAASRRPCNRARSSRRTAPGRHQGSRRTSSRSAGGGSSGDDDGESEPSRLAPRWRHTGSHRLAEAAAIRRYFDSGCPLWFRKLRP